MLEHLKKTLSYKHGARLSTVSVLAFVSDMTIDNTVNLPLQTILYGSHPEYGEVAAVVRVVGDSYFLWRLARSTARPQSLAA